MALAWQGKHQVKVLNYVHNPTMKQMTRQAKGRTLTPDKPVVIWDYTKNMGGADRADHYIASYGFTRKSIKWWRKLFFFLDYECMDCRQLSLDKDAAGFL